MESSFGNEPVPSPAHTVPLHLEYYSVQRPFSDTGREMDEGVQSSCQDRVHKGRIQRILPKMWMSVCIRILKCTCTLT